jgi:2-methylisocitrate lyase-like PEP mutase family enzyme
MSSSSSPAADNTSRAHKAAVLRALHVPGNPLVVPNAWDAVSATMVIDAGFPVIATSSAATSAILGYADGEATPVDEVLSATSRIVRVVNAPVTVDFERGYGLLADELVERFSTTGAVGLNLEDSHPQTGEMIDPAEQEHFLASVRKAAVARGVDLVINARTDSFLRHAGTPAEQLEATIERGKRYLAAGADCVYPIGLADFAVIRQITERIAGPINVSYGRRGERPLAELAALGVARISFGPSLQRQLYSKFAAALFTALADDRNPFEL